MTREQAFARAFLRALDVKLLSIDGTLAWCRLDRVAWPDFSFSGDRK